MERVTAMLVECGVASRPLEPGESGDAHLVHPQSGGTLIAVVDGLGHGPAAAAASRAAIRLLASAEAAPSLAAIRTCHLGLRETRGVVMALAWIDGVHGSMTWTGVGNVQGVLRRSGGMDTLVGRGGVVGRQLPPLHAGTVAIAPGDLLILATDGIRPAFSQQVPDREPPQAIADAIMARHYSGVDDALVLVARYRGPDA